MKYSLSILSAVAFFVSFACSNNVQNANQPVNGQVYGDTIMEGSFLPLADLQAQLQLNESVNATITGTVTDVCTKKGCWLKISMPDSSKMFVDFKDYGFFVPKDIKGSKVVLEGKGYYAKTSVEELKHYAKDAGKSETEIAAITQPKKELRFTATGVHVNP